MGYDLITEEKDKFTVREQKNAVRNSLFRLLDDAILCIAEEKEKLEEEVIDQEAKKEDDPQLIEIADKLIEKGLVPAFALNVFGREIINEQITAFLTWASLIAKVNVKIGGQTCLGKSTIASCVEKALPNSWFLKIGYSDPAALKNKMRKTIQEGRMFRILYLQEEDSKSEHEQMNLRLTHNDDGGLKILISKKANDSEYYADTEEIDIPPITILTTSTKLTFDKQDLSRRLELSPNSSRDQNKAVVNLKFLYKQFPHLKPNPDQEYAILRIIAKRISESNAKVLNPFMDESLVRLSYESSTIRREIDQLISLADIITRLNYQNRIKIEVNKEEHVISSLSDLAFITNLGSEIFAIGDPLKNETQKKLMKVIKTLLTEMSVSYDEDHLDDYEHYRFDNKFWVPTTLILDTYNETYDSLSNKSLYEQLLFIRKTTNLLSWKKVGRSVYYHAKDHSDTLFGLTDNYQSKADKQLEEWFSGHSPEMLEALPEREALKETLIDELDVDRLLLETRSIFEETILEEETKKHDRLLEKLFKKGIIETKQILLDTFQSKDDEEKKNQTLDDPVDNPFSKEFSMIEEAILELEKAGTPTTRENIIQECEGKVVLSHIKLMIQADKLEQNKDTYVYSLME
jgi:hypothetical protein